MSDQIGLQERNMAEREIVPPVLPLHHQLVQIWEEVLHVHPIGITEDFFELGGHSLLAIQMLNRVRQVCGKQLPLATLFSGATIEYLASVLQEESSEARAQKDPHWRTPLVPIKTDGSLPPFFYLHGDWKDGSFYSIKLAHGLGPDQPFYNLEPYIFEDQSVPPSFEAIAAAYIQAMREVQPEGPYRLGGFCNGALIAYEMACQLYEAGEEVETLLLINPARPTPHSGIYTALRRFGSLVRLPEATQVDLFLLSRQLQRLQQQALRRRRVRSGDSLALEEEQERQKIKQAQKEAAQKPGSATKLLRADWSSLYDWTILGASLYRYPGKITLLWSQGEQSQALWEQMTRANERAIYDILGTHRSCRTVHLQALIDQVKACLEQDDSASSEAADEEWRSMATV
ncbi:hypothetical protein EPA93_24160 [Ktedonosporobacter rubrisoli]|uniref:Carrier domain-containing protein n=1 Tax=Ktedonosporobacter rubrisoli TaxID=2509675 RepID=A0A4P6JTK7_KTERU|nr:thioesterase domain-containing protein [Ktedonosporobacter rubrisoli]QBD78908.1 hypothetical protein EPA93_24160 [Ktedonosporobacter rubrisoli]